MRDKENTEEDSKMKRITLQKDQYQRNGDGGKDLCMIIINGNWWHKRMRTCKFIGFRQANKGHVSIAIQSK